MQALQETIACCGSNGRLIATEGICPEAGISLKWRWGEFPSHRGPRQVLGTFGRAYEPTRHLRDITSFLGRSRRQDHQRIRVSSAEAFPGIVAAIVGFPAIVAVELTFTDVEVPCDHARLQPPPPVKKASLAIQGTHR